MFINSAMALWYIHLYVLIYTETPLFGHEQAFYKGYSHDMYIFGNLMKKSILWYAPELSKPSQMMTYTQNTKFYKKI